MPGILPMKVIQVGSSSQARIAQACDRCRSKKIRCDGIRPCCSQCANVGFECRTSDKLSRRAFPRGYTETLEERVRALEAEIRELKDLLDEKDEKIDLLSKMHSNSPFSAPRASPPRRRSSTRSQISPGGVRDAKAKGEAFRTQQLPSLVDGENTDPYFIGGSSGRVFVDAFKLRLRELGKSRSDFNMEAFFSTRPSQSPEIATPALQGNPPVPSGPSRMVSDQLINIYFQEWAPLFPVLHRPTFFRSYEKYTAGNGTKGDEQIVAQLYLIYSIAAISDTTSSQADVAAYEKQWQAALDAILAKSTLGTLQCLILAQMYCIAKRDYAKLQYYKAISVGLSHRLGLHQCQKRFSLGALACESRKKVFWTLYTLDCFSAASQGLPKLLNDEDVRVEFPVDADDEHVSEEGFLPALPGESTRLSSALALFRVSRILAKVLKVLYPASVSHELSLQTLSAFDDELNAWSDSLAPHLKLQFLQGKPSTNVTGSRSPLLSLAYYYARTLIHRPAVGSNLGSKSSSSVVALGDSSKHIIQLVRLLQERKMTFSFCLNKHELLVLSGFGLLYQGLDLDSDGKLCRAGERLVTSVVKILDQDHADSAKEFKRVAQCLVFTTSCSNPEPPSSDTHVNGDTSAPQSVPNSSHIEWHTSLSSTTGENLTGPEDTNGTRRATAPALPRTHLYKSRSQSQLSIASSRSEPLPRSPNIHRMSIPGVKSRQSNTSLRSDTPNLDYLPLPSVSGSIDYRIKTIGTPGAFSIDSGDFLETTGSGQTGSYHKQDGGPLLGAFVNSFPASADLTTLTGWSSSSPWDTGALYNSAQCSGGRVMRPSDDSPTSGVGLTRTEYTAGSYGGRLGLGNDYQGILMPNVIGSGDGFTLDGLDCTFGL